MTAVSEPFDPADLERRVRELEALVKPTRTELWPTLRQASEATGIPKRTLNYWVRIGRLVRGTDCHMFRGMWFVNPAWVASQAALNPRK